MAAKGKHGTIFHRSSAAGGLAGRGAETADPHVLGIHDFAGQAQDSGLVVPKKPPWVTCAATPALAIPTCTAPPASTASCRCNPAAAGP